MKKAQSRFSASRLAFIALGFLLLSLLCFLCLGADYSLAGERAPAGLSPFPYWSVWGDQPEASFGAAISKAGDVNGDGYDDVIVGARTYDIIDSGEGRVYVYYGSPFGLSPTPDWIAEGDKRVSVFGFSVSTAGDVNSDGFDDVIVGAPAYSNDQIHEGRAFVYYGSAAGLVATPAWVAEGNKHYTDFGYSVSSAGDVNDDGFDDVIVGAAGYDNDQGSEGRAYVYHGSASGPSPSPNWTVESNMEQAAFGYSVSTAGDVNADGFDDVIIGADMCDNGELQEGRVYVYCGSASGLSPTPDWTAESNQVQALFGRVVSTAGDVNGDGFDDVIIGAPFYENDQGAEGAVFAWFGSAAGLGDNGTLDNADWFVEGNQLGAFLGGASTAGDVNGDGFNDVIVGTGGYPWAGPLFQAAFVYHGSVSGLSLSPDWTAEGDQADSAFGHVSTAGDVNGDGYDDVIIGAPGYDIIYGNEGRVFAFYGSGPRPPLTVNSSWTLYY